MKNFLTIVSLSAFLAGCVSTISENSKVFVYINGSNSISVMDETFKSTEIDRVPLFLLESGATPQTEIQIISMGNTPGAFTRSVANACWKKGLAGTIIKEKVAPRAFTQPKGQGIELPPPPPPQKPGKIKIR